MSQGTIDILSWPLICPSWVEQRSGSSLTASFADAQARSKERGGPPSGKRKSKSASVRADSVPQTCSESPPWPRLGLMLHDGHQEKLSQRERCRPDGHREVRAWMMSALGRCRKKRPSPTGVTMEDAVHLQTTLHCSLDPRWAFQITA